jgi:hypothetical protein
MNKKKLKKREEKEENNKKKWSKSYTKKEKPKKLGRMVAPVHFDPKILPKGSAKLRKMMETGELFVVYRECDGRRGWARSAPFCACQSAQKDGCAQRTGAHARPEPTSNQ